LLQNYLKILPLLIITFGCLPAPKFFVKPDNKQSTKLETQKNNNYLKLKPIKSVVGMASFYAEQFHGRITFNGEVYDMYGLTAAHPTYPMNTIIRVTNLKNGKKTIIRINDRMPYRSDRIIDLSFGTAKALGMIPRGIQQVRLDILKWGNNSRFNNLILKEK